jgi:hypothetical protein
MGIPREFFYDTPGLSIKSADLHSFRIFAGKLILVNRQQESHAKRSDRLYVRFSA